jgi:hypothetical protein
MSKTGMPSRSRDLADVEDLFGRSCWGAAKKRIKPSSRLVLKKSFPRFPILNKKEIRMKFKKDIIIRGDTMNGSKVLR